MKNLVIAALMLTHSWYPQECCHDKDCLPVPCVELKVMANGAVVWKGVLYFSGQMLRDSLDGQCHVCVEEGPQRRHHSLSADMRFPPARDELSAMIRWRDDCQRESNDKAEFPPGSARPGVRAHDWREVK